MIFNRMFNLCLFTACLNLQSNLSNSENLIRSRRLSVKDQPQTTTTVRTLTQDEFRTTMLRGIRESLKRNRMMRMINKHILQPGRKEICYETVGCFDLPRKHLPIMKAPESPLTLNTKFYLFRRDINFSTPELLDYENISTVIESKFNPNRTIKFIIHGYMSTWDEVGALTAVKAYLKIDDYNVVLVDWANGAKGPNYRTAAANTEVVGRQVGVLLLSMLKLGADPNRIHLLGFSLGAHIAGVASEVLKLKGSLIGRITALDPASPLFKHHLLRDQSKKLDITDARFVDVIHTDGSPIWTDGFGLLEPIGHVDFFPNGGREQSGCNDGRGSVVVAQFEPLNRDLACSHIRAWQYYLESLLTKAYNPENGCKFIAYPCATGLVGFTYGRCFPVNLFNNNNRTLVLDSNYRSDFGYLGEDVKGYGPMYLVTQNHKPFCGTQLQAVIRVSQKTQQTRGILQLQIKYDNNQTTNFQIKCELLDIIPVGHNMHGLSAAEYNSLNTNTTKMIANLSYQSLAFQSPHNVTISPKLFLDKIQVRDMFGNSWQFCGLETEVVDKHGEFFETLTVELNKKIC